MDANLASTLPIKKLPSTVDTRCGTDAGYKAHKRRFERRLATGTSLRSCRASFQGRF